METSWIIICFTFSKVISGEAPSEHRIFASREKRLCHLLAENMLVWCGSDGMMESFGETGRVLLRFIQRASLAISCVSSRRAQTRFSRVPFSIAPTDCQDSIPVNFRSRARKHVSSRGWKEADNEQMRFCKNASKKHAIRILRKIWKFMFFFPEIKTGIIFRWVQIYRYAKKIFLAKTRIRDNWRVHDNSLQRQVVFLLFVNLDKMRSDNFLLSEIVPDCSQCN